MAENKSHISTFSKMWKDAPLSMPPEGSYLEAWNAINETEEFNGFGLANERSTEEYIEYPDGTEVRGQMYLEEHDEWVLFLLNPETGMSEIGIADQDKGTYKKLIDDDDIVDGDLCFSRDEWIRPVSKYVQKEGCKDLFIYWSNNYEYYRLNLNGDHCNTEYEDLLLLPCTESPIIETERLDDGGVEMENGTYYYVPQLEDRDGNRTNWFNFTQPVYIADGNHEAGEKGRQSVRIRISNLDDNYDKIRVAMVKVTGGAVSEPRIIFDDFYGKGEIVFDHRGIAQEQEVVPMTDILSDDTKWIKGKSLKAVQGHLVLYNILGHQNLDYQRYANKINAEYYITKIPAEYAEEVKGLRGDEVYAPGIKFNYCDGTSSVSFLISGREANEYDREIIPANEDANCVDCERERWEVENTARKLWCEDGQGGENLIEESEGNSTDPSDTDYEPGQEYYEEYVEELPEEVQDALDQLDGAGDNDFDCDCMCPCDENISISLDLNEPGGGTEVSFGGGSGPSDECCEQFKQGGGLGGLFGNMFNSIDSTGMDGRGATDSPDRETFVNDRAGLANMFADADYGAISNDGGLGERGTTSGDLPKINDLNGDPIDVFGNVEDGKVVVIDFFATWCGPCWTCHESGMMEELHNEYGMNGADVARFYGLEGDPSTPIDALHGNGNTQGDYVSGTSYQMANLSNEQVQAIYDSFGNIAGFPTFIVVTPNGEYDTFTGCPSKETLEDLINGNAGTPPEDQDEDGDQGGDQQNCGGKGQCPDGDCRGNCGGGGCEDCGDFSGSGNCGGGIRQGGCGGSDSNTVLSGCGQGSTAYCMGGGNTCYDPELDIFNCYSEPQSVLEYVQKAMVKHRPVREGSTYVRNRYKRDNQGTTNSLTGNGGSGQADEDKFTYVKVYDEEGCEVIDKKFPIVCRGLPGYYESERRYPYTKDCNGNYLWGELAGKPIRLPRMPSRDLEPHFISYQNGVVHADDRGNIEWQDTYIRHIGLSFFNIQMPENLPKPLDPNNPFSITYIERDTYNKSVIASGTFHHTYLGDVYGRTMAFGALGSNSCEYFDRNIATGADNDYRGGGPSDVPGYIFHSPDTHFDRPALTTNRIKVDLELFGEGWRHGHYAEGEEPDSIFKQQVSQRGTRQSINLNHYRLPQNVQIVSDGDEVDCCIEIEEVDVDLQLGLDLLDLPGSEVEAIYTASIESISDLSESDIYSVHITEPTIGSTTDYSVPFNAYISHTRIFEDIITPIPIPVQFEITVTTQSGCVYTGTLETAYPRPEQQSNGYTITESLTLQCDEKQTGDPSFDRLEGQFVRCVRGAKYAPADSVVENDEDLTYPLMNVFREESVYLELDEPDDRRLTFSDEIHGPIDRPNGNTGWPGGLNGEDTAECDCSFIPTTVDHTCPIFRAGAWYGSLKNEQKAQYGQVAGSKMIPLGIEGTWDDLLCGRAEGLAGDTSINFFSLRRSAYVSNKVGEGKYYNASAFLRFFGWGDCSILPKSGNTEDSRNTDGGMRLGGCWNGEAPYPSPSGSDVYYPRTLKTLLMYWAESDVNVDYRQIGTRERPARQVHYPENEPYQLDSSMGDETDYDNSFLNWFAHKHKHIPQWKILLRIALRLFVIIVLPIIAFNNVSMHSFVDLPSVVRIAVTTGLLAIIIFGVATPQNLDILLGIWRYCATDDEGGDEIEPIYGWWENFYRYNFDYSWNNPFNWSIVMPDDYYVCDCQDEQSQKMIYSDKQTPASRVDSWKNFRVNNYLLMPAEGGQIRNIFTEGRETYVHTTDMIYQMFSSSDEIQTEEGNPVYLRRNNLFQAALPIAGDIQEGYMGLKHPNSTFTSKFGYIFPDEEARQVYLFRGGNADPISNAGVRNFIKEHMDIKLLEHFPNYPLVDTKGKFSVGYEFGIDHRHNRILITKRDYEPKEDNLRQSGNAFLTEDDETVFLGDPEYFEDVGWTLSYYPVGDNSSWVSFHSYKPDIYLNDRHDMYGIKDGKMWRHNTGEGYGEFYGEQHPFVVEVAAYDPKSWGELQLKNIMFDVDADEFFDRLMLYNSYQSTGLIETIDGDKLSDIDKSKERTEIPFYKDNGVWTINNIKSRVDGSDEPLLIPRVNAPDEPNEGILSSPGENMQDKFIVLRMVYSEQDTLMLMKRVLFNQKDPS